MKILLCSFLAGMLLTLNVSVAQVIEADICSDAEYDLFLTCRSELRDDLKVNSKSNVAPGNEITTQCESEIQELGIRVYCLRKFCNFDCNDDSEYKNETLRYLELACGLNDYTDTDICDLSVPNSATNISPLLGLLYIMLVITFTKTII